MGDSIEIEKGEQLFVGDLVTFHGYHYTPDYLMIDDKDGSLGIITEVKINSPIGTISYDSFVLYTVHWFASGKSTTEVSEHLKRISP
tara:strand:- start:2405 stop:2665 length:261 start_codon:yes stop_codon:yes gene_type:complete